MGGGGRFNNFLYVCRTLLIKKTFMDMKRLRFGIVLATMFFMMGQYGFAQKGAVWVNPFIGISYLNVDNSVFKTYGCDKDAVVSSFVGYDLGYNITDRFSVFFDFGLESVGLEKFEHNLDILSTSIGINAAYKFWKSHSSWFSMDFRLGFGFYGSKITYANSNPVPPTTEPMAYGVFNSVANQDFNLYLPVGFSFNLFEFDNSKAVIHLVYRHSFDTGTTRIFGGNDKLSDYPFNKLNSLYVSVGYTFAL